MKPDVNRLRLTAICLLANFVAAGFLMTMGLVTGPLSEQFDIDITVVSKLFSWLTGSYFIASIVTFWLLDYLSMKAILLYYAAMTITASICVLFNTSSLLLAVILTVIGFFCGTSICISGTIIGKIWKHKRQQVALLTQDSVFNIGGVVFSFLTAYVLSAGWHWGVSYVAAALPLIIGVYWIVTSNFRFEEKRPPGQQEEVNVVWNLRIILAGIWLFSILTVKYSVIIWLPNYAETHLAATDFESGALVARIFSVALIGSIVGVILITKVKLTLFVLAALLIGLLSSMQFTRVSDLTSLMFVVSIYGLTFSVLYNGFVAYGIELIKRPSHKHISYIIFCGGAGSMVAPLMSGLFVESFGIIALFNAVAAVYGVVLLTVIFNRIGLLGRLLPKFR